MAKIWFILIEGNKEGPFSLEELRQDLRINPDTLVWKSGFKQWVPIRKVPELKKVFEDPRKKEDVEDQKTKKKFKKISQEDEVIAIQTDPPFTFLWLILAWILLYVMYQFYK